MTTTITSRIGNAYPTNREYPTPVEWAAALPASLVAADEIHIGELYNDNDQPIDYGPSDNPCPFGSTTDETRYIELRCAPGHSWIDNVVPGVDPVTLNPAKGVVLRNVSHRGNVISFDTSHFRVRGIQTVSGWRAIETVSAAGGVCAGGNILSSVEDCLCVTINNQGGISIAGTVSARNCYSIITGGSGSFFGVGAGNFSTPGRLDNCTGIAVNGATASIGIAATGGNIDNVHIRNVAVLGCTTVLDTTFADSVNATVDYIATDNGTVAIATHTLISLTTADQFVDASATADGNGFPVGLDLSLLSTADLIGFGEENPSGGLFSDDAFGATRGVSWDCGAQQFVTGGGGPAVFANPFALLGVGRAA